MFGNHNLIVFALVIVTISLVVDNVAGTKPDDLPVEVTSRIGGFLLQR